MTQRVLTILWPAFVMACVLEILVFALVDPAELHGFGGSAAGWSPLAIYSLAFLAFWAAIAVAAAISVHLASAPPSGGAGTALR